MGDVKKDVEAKELRNQFESLKKDVTDMGRSLKNEISEKLSEAHQRIVGESGEWVKEHPAASVGIVAGVAASIGFVLGLLAGRGRG